MQLLSFVILPLLSSAVYKIAACRFASQSNTDERTNSLVVTSLKRCGVPGGLKSEERRVPKHVC
jgi:hypothetical protein